MEEDLITIMAGQSDQALRERIETACDVMEKNYAANFYTKIRVLRHWSKHTPTASFLITAGFISCFEIWGNDHPNRFNPAWHISDSIQTTFGKCIVVL